MVDIRDHGGSFGSRLNGFEYAKNDIPVTNIINATFNNITARGKILVYQPNNPYAYIYLLGQSFTARDVGSTLGAVDGCVYISEDWDIYMYNPGTRIINYFLKEDNYVTGHSFNVGLQALTGSTGCGISFMYQGNIYFSVRTTINSSNFLLRATLTGKEVTGVSTVTVPSLGIANQAGHLDISNGIYHYAISNSAIGRVDIKNMSHSNIAFTRPTGVSNATPSYLAYRNGYHVLITFSASSDAVISYVDTNKPSNSYFKTLEVSQALRDYREGSDPLGEIRGVDAVTPMYGKYALVSLGSNTSMAYIPCVIDIDTAEVIKMTPNVPRTSQSSILGVSSSWKTASTVGVAVDYKKKEW